MEDINKYKNGIESYPVFITALTPICVKSHDEPFSPLTDYVCDGDKIHFINQKKFLEILTKEEGLLEKYADMVNNIDTQEEHKHDNFKCFLDENNISISQIANYSRRYSIPGNLTEISRHIHSAGRIYIPGSTLKGVARSALFSEFYQDPQNRIQVEKVLKALKKKAKKKIYYDSKQGVTEAEKFFVAKEGQMMYNNASIWGFEDSEFLDSKDISVIQLNRKRLVYKEEEKDLETLSVLQEVILSGAIIKTKLFVKNTSLDSITKGKLNNSHDRQNITTQSVFKALNLFAQSFIAYQKEHIHHSDTAQYKSQLEELEKLVVDFLADNKKALFCIGFGKSLLQNTIALSVQNNWNRLHIDTPTTCFTEAQTGQTIGWCVIGTEAFNYKKIIKEYELTEIAECNPKAEVIVQVKSIPTVKPKALIANTLFKGNKTEIRVIGLSHTNFKEKDWIIVELMDKSKLGEFKQARFKKEL